MSATAFYRRAGANVAKGERHGKVLVRSGPQIGISSQKRTFSHRTPTKKDIFPYKQIKKVPKKEKI
jgi:hypothetical protein